MPVLRSEHLCLWLHLGESSKGSISSHCWSVNSCCRFFMAEAYNFTCLNRKYLL